MRYLKFLILFTKFSIIRSTGFKLDFYFRIIMDLCYYGVHLGMFHVLYSHSSVFAGWTEYQGQVFVSIFLLTDALHMTLFSNNLWYFPEYINKGTLDYYLLRPISPLFFMSFRDIAINSFVNLLMAFAIFLFYLAKLPQGAVTFSSILCFGFMFMVGFFLHYALRMITIIPVFFSQSSRGIESVFWALQRFIEKPDRMFYGVARLMLVTILPFSLVASFPARILIEGIRYDVVLIQLIVALFFGGVLNWFWEKGLANYGSASS